jgi:hypothetical protein
MRTPTQTLIQRAELTDSERKAVGKAVQLYPLNRLSVPEDVESSQGPLILRLDGAEPPTALVEDVVGDYKKNITRYQTLFDIVVAVGEETCEPLASEEFVEVARVLRERLNQVLRPHKAQMKKKIQAARAEYKKVRTAPKASYDAEIQRLVEKALGGLPERALDYHPPALDCRE